MALGHFLDKWHQTSSWLQTECILDEDLVDDWDQNADKNMTLRKKLKMFMRTCHHIIQVMSKSSIQRLIYPVVE